MDDQISVRYFKRDQLTYCCNVEATKVENQEVVFQVTDGIILSVFKRSLYRKAFVACSSTLGKCSSSDEVRAELQWLAINQRGIFRLLAMYLKPHSKAYSHMVAMASEHGITI